MVIAGIGWIATTPPVPAQTPAQLATAFKPDPLPRPPTAYEQGWDGGHCQHIYTEQTLLDFPAVPTFRGGTA